MLFEFTKKSSETKLITIIWLTTITVYITSLPGNFVHDDVPAIIRNHDVSGITLKRWSLFNLFTNDYWGSPIANKASHKSYRPFTVLTFAFNASFTPRSLNAFFFHFTNIILHAFLTQLLFYTFKRFLPAIASLGLALHFAVHPVHTEAVSNCVGRAEILAAIFVLYAYQQKYSEKIVPKLMHFSFSILAMLCKETGITILGIVLVFYALRFGKLPQTSRLIISGLIVIFRVLIFGQPEFQKQDNPASFNEDFLVRYGTFCVISAKSLFSLIFPNCLVYDWQFGSIPLVETLGDDRLIPVVLIGVYLVSCLYINVKNRYWFTVFGLLFLTISFIPSSNLLITVGFVMAERVLYLPSIGYSILILCGWSRIYQTMVVRKSAIWIKMLFLVFSFITLISFSLKTLDRGSNWSNKAVLFKHDLKMLPNNAKMHYNFGNLARDYNKNDIAKKHYEIAIELFPEYPSAMNNLATVLQDSTDMNDVNQAEQFFRDSIKMDRDNPNPYINLANLLSMTGQVKQAFHVLIDAIDNCKSLTDRNFNIAALNLAKILGDYGHPDLAKKLFEHVIQISQKSGGSGKASAEEYNHFGAFLTKHGRYTEAEDYYLKALKVSPKHFDTLVNYAWTLQAQGRVTLAESYYKMAIQANSRREIGDKKLALALDRLGSLYFSVNRYEDAERNFRESVSLNDENGNVKAHLAAVLVNIARDTEAELLLREAVENDVNCKYLEATKNLASLHGIHGRHANAVEILEKCLKSVRDEWKKVKKNAEQTIDLKNDDYLKKKSKHLKTKLLAASVVDEVDSKDKQDMDYAELYQQLGKHYRDMAKGEDGLELNQKQHFLQRSVVAYEECLSLDSQQVKCSLGLAQLFHNAGAYTKAKDFYSRTLELDPNNKNAKQNIALL